MSWVCFCTDFYLLCAFGIAFDRMRLRGFGAGRVSKTHIWINCNSFCFIFLFGKYNYKSWKFTDLGFQVWDFGCFKALFGSGSFWSVVAEQILFSACSRLVGSGMMVVSCFCRASMAWLPALTFLSCCSIVRLSRFCSACWQIFFSSALKVWSGLRCSLGRYWRPTGQEPLLWSVLLVRRATFSSWSVWSRNGRFCSAAFWSPRRSVDDTWGQAEKTGCLLPSRNWLF